MLHAVSKNITTLHRAVLKRDQSAQISAASHKHHSSLAGSQGQSATACPRTMTSRPETDHPSVTASVRGMRHSGHSAVRTRPRPRRSQLSAPDCVRGGCPRLSDRHPSPDSRLFAPESHPSPSPDSRLSALDRHPSPDSRLSAPRTVTRLQIADCLLWTFTLLQTANCLLSTVTRLQIADCLLWTDTRLSVSRQPTVCSHRTDTRLADCLLRTDVSPTVCSAVEGKPCRQLGFTVAPPAGRPDLTAETLKNTAAALQGLPFFCVGSWCGLVSGGDQLL